MAQIVWSRTRPIRLLAIIWLTLVTKGNAGKGCRKSSTWGGPQMNSDRHRFRGPSSRFGLFALNHCPGHEFAPWKMRLGMLLIGVHRCVSVVAPGCHSPGRPRRLSRRDQATCNHTVVFFAGRLPDLTQDRHRFRVEATGLHSIQRKPPREGLHEFMEEQRSGTPDDWGRG